MMSKGDKGHGDKVTRGSIPENGQKGQRGEAMAPLPKISGVFQVFSNVYQRVATRGLHVDSRPTKSLVTFSEAGQGSGFHREPQTRYGQPGTRRLNRVNRRLNRVNWVS